MNNNAAYQLYFIDVVNQLRATSEIFLSISFLLNCTEP